MKTKILLIGTFALAACGQTGASAPSNSDAEALTQGATPAQFQKFDVNGDGKIDATEVPADVWDVLKVADADGDGAVTLDEIINALIAGTFKPKHPHGKGHHPHCPPFWHLDADKDGAITQAEAGKFWPELVKADANGDGKVTEDEIKAAIAAGIFAGPPPREHHERFEKLDKNHDGIVTKAEAGSHWGKIEIADADQNGEVTEAEFDAAVQAGLFVKEEDEEEEEEEEHHNQGPGGATGGTGKPGPGPGGELFEKFDANDDGVLEASEVPEELWDEKVSKADADNDGKVTVAEWETYRANHKPH